MDKHFSELLRGAAGGLAARIVAAACVFLFGVYLARLLGAADSGLFYLALAVVTVPAVVARVGLDGSVVRFVAAHLARDEPDAAGAVYRRAVLIVAVVAALIAVTLAASADWLANSVFAKPELGDALGEMAWLLLPLALLMLHGQFLQADKRIAAAVIVQTGMVPLLCIAGFSLAGGDWSLSAAARLYAAAGGITLLLGAAWLHATRPYRLTGARDYDFAPLAASARSLAVSDLINKVIQPWAPIIFLGFWGTAAEIGLFGAANRLAALTAFAAMPVNRTLAPKMAALWAENDRPAFFRVANQATLLMLAIAIPIGIVILVVPGNLMALFGDEFVAAASLLVIMALAQLVNALTGPVRSMLIMTGHESDHRLSSGVGGVAVLALCVALIPPYGAAGAAWAAGAGLVVNNVVAALLVYWRLGTIPLLWK